MTTTKAPGDGLPAQLPDENFHDYMSRLYREQGLARGESPYLQARFPQQLYAQFWQFLHQRAGAIPPDCSTRSSNYSKTKRTNAEHHCCRSPRQRPRAAHHPIRPRDHQLLPGRQRLRQGRATDCLAEVLHLGQAWRGLAAIRPQRPQVTISGKAFHDTWMGKDGETVKDLCVDVQDFSLPPREQPQQQEHARLQADEAIPF